MELVAQVGRLGPTSGDGGVVKGRLKVDIALARGRAPALAGGLVVARSDPGPGRKTRCAAKARHVDAMLRDHGGRHHGIDAGDRGQQELLDALRIADDSSSNRA